MVLRLVTAIAKAISPLMLRLVALGFTVDVGVTGGCCRGALNGGRLYVTCGSELQRHCSMIERPSPTFLRRRHYGHVVALHLRLVLRASPA